MRKRAKVDANHGEIVAALEVVGASVRSLASVGDGCLDLLVGFRGTNYYMEVKDGSKPPSARKLTGDEQDEIDRWRGQCCVVECVDDAYRAIGLIA